MDRKQAILNSFSVLPGFISGSHARGRFLEQFLPLFFLLFICQAPVMLIWLGIIFIKRPISGELPFPTPFSGRLPWPWA